MTQPQLTRYASCIICGSQRLHELAGSDQLASEAAHRENLFRDLFPPGTPEYMLKDRAFATQTYDARLLACDTCHTLARDPHLSPRGAMEEYEEDVYHPSWLESSFREFHAAFRERVKELIPWVGAEAHVLEIGSFVGGFLAAAEEAGWRATGVDVGECVTRFARSKGLDVRHGRVADARFPDASFDGVFVWSCFDQLPRPWQDLREISRVLRDGGRLVLRVPNGTFVNGAHRLMRLLPFDGVRESVRRILAYAGLSSFPFQVGYTPSSLRHMLHVAGFGSVRIHNGINVRGFDPDRRSFFSIPAATRALRAVHVLSQVVYYASFGALAWGPWIEVSCSLTEHAGSRYSRS
jgi:SAM-dependent methyltransferase